MTTSNQAFNGLPMPVFAAFGWAGEEQAIEYALTELEQFIQTLFARLPRELQLHFPYYGVDRAEKSVYLAAEEQPETDSHVVFLARPLSLQLLLMLEDKAALTKAWKAIARNPAAWHKTLAALGPEWTLQVQQLEYQPATGERTLYKDLFKDSVDKLDEATATEIAEKAAYLNGEENWVVPLAVSWRTTSEQASVMGMAIVDHTMGLLQALIPTIELITGRTRKQIARAKGTKAVPIEAPVEETAPVVISPDDPEYVDQFTYQAELKPLHIRRGFVNLTPQHWPFFAQNARSVTREVMVRYGGETDDSSTVWRLVPSNQARLVLSGHVQEWLDDNFDANDKIAVTAVKRADNEIEVTLTPAPSD